MFFDKKRFPIPKIEGKYKCVYRPKGDVYRGIDTAHYANDTYYPVWIVNDFSVLWQNGTWHIVGITHPRPMSFGNAFVFDSDDVHEAEYQLFHATARGEHFCDVFHTNVFKEEEKILYPQERPNERPELWAPQLLYKDDQYHVIYSPETMRHAASPDFQNWKILPPCFKVENPAARDPYVTLIDGVYYFTYTDNGYVYLRRSKDFRNWSDAVPISKSIVSGTDPESSVLFRRNGIWYIMWTTYDGRNGCYDERCFVFAAETPEELLNTTPVTMLQAHAPEFIQDRDGQDYILSVYWPENGVSAARIRWE